jgi:hypothetical protein
MYNSKKFQSFFEFYVFDNVIVSCLCKSDGEPETDEGESTQQQSLEPEKRSATDPKEKAT